MQSGTPGALGVHAGPGAAGAGADGPPHARGMGGEAAEQRSGAPCAPGSRAGLDPSNDVRPPTVRPLMPGPWSAQRGRGTRLTMVQAAYAATRDALFLSYQNEPAVNLVQAANS